MKITWLHLLLLAIFLVFWIKAIIFLDPDFGWHYEMGKLIIAGGIPKLDQFSYTMSNFLYIDHEWLTDIFIYKLYSIIGTIGLSFLWSTIAIFTLITSISRIVYLGKDNLNSKNIVLIKTITLLLGAGLILNQFGIRPQVISWFFLSLLLWLLGYWERSRLIKFAILLLFLVWANLHGEFALGIVIFGIGLIFKGLKNKRSIFLYVTIFILSILFTLLNPYGLDLWREVFNTFFNSTLRGKIGEWKPVWMSLNASYPLIVVLGTILVFRFRKCFTQESLAVFLITILMSVSAGINIPFLAIAAMPLVIVGLLLLGKEATLFKFGENRFNKALKMFMYLSVFLFIFTAFFSIKGAVRISENEFYPKDAVVYISKNLPSGEIFSHYNWGGYLIWKLPQKKVFIDGRMAHWPNILDYQFQIISSDVNYITVFDKYNIQMVLWPKKVDDAFINRIEKGGWQVVYDDKTSEVLIKIPRN